MEEKRTWVRVRRKRRLRILAVMLSVCVLVTTYSDIPVALAFSAAEESERPEGRYIVGFTALSKEIREQTVPVGTELTELSLSETLEAVITEERQPSEDTAEKSKDSEKEDTGENHGEEKDGDTAGTKENDGTGKEEDGESFDIEQEKPEEDETSETKQEEPEEGETSETKQEEPEEGEASETKQEEPEEGEASEIQQEEPEEGEPSETQQEDRSESGNTDADGETGDGQDTQSEDGGESGGTDESNKTDSGNTADTENQETHTVSMPEYYAEHVISVQTLENTSAEEEKEPQTEEREETKAEEQREPEKKGQEATVTISGVSWQAEPAYDGSAEGTYIFTAVLPEGYALAEGVSLPEITVTVCKDMENETVTAAGTLLEELMEKYFAGLLADEIYDVILAMDEDTRLSMTADYEEVIAAMTDADEADERLQSIIKTIERGLMDAAGRIPRREPAFFSVRAAAPQTAQSIPLRKLSGGGKAFVYYDFVETTSFTNGTEYAFLDGVYGHDDAVCALGSGAILKASGKSNNSQKFIQGWYGSSADVKVYVDVVKKGKDFDYCRHGGLYQVPGTGSPTEYRYFCYASGAQNCGPYYAYAYKTMTLTEANVSASLNDIDRQGSENSEDYTVMLTFDGRTVTLDQGSYTVNVPDQDADEVTIVVTDNDGNSITTKFRGPLAVRYDGNGEGAENVPTTQAAWSGERFTFSGAPTRAGYSFVNWKEEKTGSAYTKEQTITFGQKSLRLLAQWRDTQKPDFTSSKLQVMIRTAKSEVEQMVKASLTITDNEPVNECTVQVTAADNITRSVGDKTVTVAVTDKAGNTTTKDVPITVISLSLMIDTPVFTQSSKNLSAALLSPGGDAITETGIVWGIMTSPTTSVNNGRQKTTPAVTQADAKISVTADIQKGVTYYARAYAISGGETYYSNELSFGLGVPQYGTFTIKCAGSNTFTVTRTGGSDGAQTVYYRTVNGSAVGGTHFTHKADSLIFAAGETSKTITIAEAGGNAAYSGKPATGYSNADRTYSVEIYRVTGGGMLGDTVRAERTMTAGADYKIDRGIYTKEKAVENVASTTTTNGKRIADTTSAQDGKTTNVRFLTNRYNEKNYNTSMTLASYYTNDKEKEYLKNTATGWYYRYDLFAYEYEDGYEHAYMGTNALEDVHYDLSSTSAAVSGVGGQLWACNFLQGQKEDPKHYYFPDTRTGGGESAGYPLNASGSTTGYNGKTYVDLKLNETCYVYFGSTGKDDDIWYVDGLTSYAIVHDKTEPQLLAVAPMAGGLYKAGDSFVVSLIFDEIVDSQNSTLSNVKVSTNWGDAVYTGGADTNVLYFTGTVKAGASGNLSVTGITNPGNIKDMCAAAGTACASKSGNTTASVDSAEPKLTLTSKGVTSGTGTVTVKVDADQAKTSALRYAWSASTAMPASGWVEASAAELASAKGTAGLSLSIRKEPGSGNNGVWYLHVLGIYDTTGTATHKYAAVNFGTAASPVDPAPKTPTLSVSADNSNWAKSRNITVTTTNAGSGTLKYCKAGTNNWKTILLSDGSVSVTENGWYTFRLTSGEHILSQDVEVKKIDNINPTAAVGTLALSGSNQTQKAGVYTKITLPVTFGDSGSGVQTVQYRWTDTATTPTSGWSSLNASQIAAGKADISYTASENTETAKYLHVKVTDKLGNNCTTKSAASYQVISQAAVNSHTPKIAMTGEPAKWTNDTVTLTWTLSDYSGKNYEVILPDGRKAKSNAGSGEIWALRNGTYTVKVRDLDYGGENTATVTVQYIDTTAPTVTVPNAPAGWQTTAQSVTISASDSQSRVGKKYYKVVTNDQETPGEGLTEFTTSNVSISENGIWYLYYKIYDQTGDDTIGREANKTEGFVGPIKIDAKTPTLTADAPNKGVPKTAGLEVALKAVYGTSGGTVKVGNSTISALGATANDPGSSNDITKNAIYKINAKGTYQFVLTGGSGKTASQSLTVYEASFDLQGGTGTAPAQLVVKDGLLTQPTAPTKAGNEFQGWYTAAAGGEEWNFATGTVTSDCTLYARWKTDAYTVTFHKNEGMIENESSFTSYTYGTALTLPTPKRTGYTFGGWYDNEGCTGTAVTEITALAAGDKEYWAKWTPQTYQVTFDYHSADGGNTETSKNVTYDSTYGNLPAPSKTNYTFKGWYTEESGQGNKVDADTKVTKADNHTLHAYWKDETPPDQPVLQDGVTLPADWTNTQTTIPLILYDSVGVTGLQVSVDGSSYTEISGFSGGTGSVNYDYTVQNGEHTYQFKAVDAAGNFAESDIFTVKLDQTKPVIGTLTYDNKAKDFLDWIIGKKSMIIHVPVTDTFSGVTEISFCLTPRDAAGNPDSGSAVTDTATVSGGEAKITFDADFRGTIAIHCTDAAGNAADSVTIGADAGGVIVEDKAPDITIQADRSPSDTQQTQPDGVAVADGYYDTAPALLVKVKDDTDNAVTGGLALVTYQVGDDAEKPVTVDQSTLQKAAQAAFTIPASEIPTGITKITVTATDNAGNEASVSITVKVKGPEKIPGAEIDYREEELKNLVPGEKYTIDDTEYTADQEGRIPLIEDWLGTTVSIVKKGNGNETTDSPAQSLPVPARPAAPHAPELGARDETSITLQTIGGAHYRRTDGTGNWQDSAGFEGLKPGTIYSFQAYCLATDTSFASPESSSAQIATVPAAPTKEKLKIGYGAETLTLTDGIEAFTDAGCTTPVTADSAEAYMGQTIYIRYPAKGIIPESLTTPAPIPARPAKPTPGTEDASYPKAADGAITGLTSGKTYEYRVKNKEGSFGEWKDVSPNGTKIENLSAGDYQVRVKAVETGNAGFRSEAADVTVGEKPATKYDTPDIRIDYTKETLTGFVVGAKYRIGGETITAGADGALPIKKEWFGTALSIMQNGNGKDKLDSDTQSLPIPARPGKPTPTGVDVSTAGGTGKLTGLAAGVAYEVSPDGGSTWVSRTADGSGQITELAPGAYVVRVKAGTASFASENSDRAEIGAYQVKVTFMANGENYKEVFVDYGGTLTDIPAVPPKKDGGDQTYTSEWCSDQQGTPAVFTDLMADMTVYAVYTATYAVALQGGTGYTLSAQAGSTSPVKEGGSYTFGFALSNGYQKTAGFAVKVNGGKAELTADGTYTISDIRENKTVTVEGVAKKPGKPSDPGGDKDKEDDSKSESEDSAPQPSVTPPGKGKGPVPGTPSPAKADRPVPEQQKKETAGSSGGKTETQPTRGQIQEPEKQGESENRNTAADSENQNRQGKTVTDNGIQPDSGTVRSVTAAAGQGRIVISGEKIPTGNVAGMEQTSTAMTVGEGAVFVTVVCQDEKYAAGVKDTAAVANAVLSAEQVQLVNDGETIEIRVDVTDISQAVPQQDKDVIESGLMEYQKQVPALRLGRYVDISMFMKIGGNDWNAITSTEEPIEVVIGIPEDIQKEGREFYIIRAHEGEHTFMRDLDEEPDTVTISTDMFSSYAIAYVETDGTEAENGAKCGLCHICPTFLGICCFIWLAAAIVILLVIAVYILRRKEKE